MPTRTLVQQLAPADFRAQNLLNTQQQLRQPTRYYFKQLLTLSACYIYTQLIANPPAALANYQAVLNEIQNSQYAGSPVQPLPALVAAARTQQLFSASAADTLLLNSPIAPTSTYTPLSVALYRALTWGTADASTSAASTPNLRYPFDLLYLGAAANYGTPDSPVANAQFITDAGPSALTASSPYGANHSSAYLTLQAFLTPTASSVTAAYSNLALSLDPKTGILIKTVLTDPTATNLPSNAQQAFCQDLLASYSGPQNNANTAPVPLDQVWLGAICTADNQCCGTNFCNFSLGQAALPHGAGLPSTPISYGLCDSCQTAADTGPGLATCTTNSCCPGYSCTNGVCTPICGALNASCASTLANCCQADLFCTSLSQTCSKCLGYEQTACQQTNDCCQDDQPLNCINQLCINCLAAGTKCGLKVTDTGCCHGNSCQLNTQLQPTCATCRTTTQSCLQTSDCCPNLVCTQGACQQPNGCINLGSLGCANDDQCCPGDNSVSCGTINAQAACCISSGSATQCDEADSLPNHGCCDQSRCEGGRCVMAQLPASPASSGGSSDLGEILGIAAVGTASIAFIGIGLWIRNIIAESADQDLVRERVSTGRTVAASRDAALPQPKTRDGTAVRQALITLGVPENQIPESTSLLAESLLLAKLQAYLADQRSKVPTDVFDPRTYFTIADNGVITMQVTNQDNLLEERFIAIDPHAMPIVYSTANAYLTGTKTANDVPLAGTVTVAAAAEPAEPVAVTVTATDPASTAAEFMVPAPTVPAAATGIEMTGYQAPTDLAAFRAALVSSFQFQLDPTKPIPEGGYHDLQTLLNDQPAFRIRLLTLARILYNQPVPTDFAKQPEWLNEVGKIALVVVQEVQGHGENPVILAADATVAPDNGNLTLATIPAPSGEFNSRQIASTIQRYSADECLAGALFSGIALPNLESLDAYSNPKLLDNALELSVSAEDPALRALDGEIVAQAQQLQVTLAETADAYAAAGLEPIEGGA